LSHLLKPQVFAQMRPLVHLLKGVAQAGIHGRQDELVEAVEELAAVQGRQALLQVPMDVAALAGYA
jgi:hypothetical protein